MLIFIPHKYNNKNYQYYNNYITIIHIHIIITIHFKKIENNNYLVTHIKNRLLTFSKNEYFLYF